MTRAEIAATLRSLEYKGWTFYFHNDPMEMYLQICFTDEHDQRQTGRKWRISKFMTKGEIVQTALKAVLTAEEHEARERFLYRGYAIFGPHFDIEALHALAEKQAPDVRSREEETVAHQQD